MNRIQLRWKRVAGVAVGGMVFFVLLGVAYPLTHRQPLVNGPSLAASVVTPAVCAPLVDSLS